MADVVKALAKDSGHLGNRWAMSGGRQPVDDRGLVNNTSPPVNGTMATGLVRGGDGSRGKDGGGVRAGSCDVGKVSHSPPDSNCAGKISSSTSSTVIKINRATSMENLAATAGPVVNDVFTSRHVAALDIEPLKQMSPPAKLSYAQMAQRHKEHIGSQPLATPVDSDLAPLPATTQTEKSTRSSALGVLARSNHSAGNTTSCGSSQWSRCSQDVTALPQVDGESKMQDEW